MTNKKINSFAKKIENIKRFHADTHGEILFKKFIQTSKPKKQAAFAGNALNITGTIPLYKASGPSRLINSRKTSRIPFLYVPSGAVWKRLLSTSAGIPIAQLLIPAQPPANIAPNITLPPSMPHFSPAHFLTHSYVKKYAPEAGTSEKKKRKIRE